MSLFKVIWLCSETDRLIREGDDIINGPARETEKILKKLEKENERAIASAAAQRMTADEKIVNTTLLVLGVLCLLIPLLLGRWWSSLSLLGVGLILLRIIYLGKTLPKHKNQILAEERLRIENESDIDGRF